MKIEQFIKDTKLSEMGEVDRAAHLAFFQYKVLNKLTFTMSDIKTSCETLHFATPNVSRLRDNLVSKRYAIWDKRTDTLRLQRTKIEALEAQYPSLSSRDESVIDTENIIPEVVYKGTRPYVESLAKQINVSYEYNIFDGCAVLMRRLQEVLLISAYEKPGFKMRSKEAMEII